MSAEWRKVKLREVCNIRRGSSPRPIVNFMAEAGMPWVKISDATESNSRFISKTKEFIKEEGVKNSVIVNKGDLILSNSGTAGLPKFMEITACIHDGWQVFSELDLIDKHFLYYTLINIRSSLLHNAYDSTMKNLTLDMVRDAEVLLPPIGVQESIAARLGVLDDKIELNRQTNQTLEQIAQAIFKSWFVDFEPTRAKIIAKEQGANPATQELAAQAIICGAITLEQLAEVEQNLETTLQQAIDEKLNQHKQTNPTALNAQQLKTTAALFPNELVESELGDVPEGWDCQALSGWGDIVCGKTPSKKKDEYYGGNIPFIKIPDMHGNMYAIETVDSLTKEGAETQKKKRLPKGSVCVSCIATVGQVVIACEDSFTNQQINSIVPLESSYTPYLYFAMLEQYDYLHDLASGGSATLNLNTGNFSKIQIIKPSPELLNTFSQVVQPIMDNILTNSYQQQVLASIRDSLLPKLLSGELDVSALADNSQAGA